MDGAPQAETEGNSSTSAAAVGGMGLSGSAEVLMSESSCGTEASSSHCDVVLMNGNGLNSDCSTESSLDQDVPGVHRDVCLDAIYNLYAISVSKDTNIREGVIYI